MKRKTRYVILGLLREEELTGYEIKKSIDLRMKFFWQESYGQIYPELNAMTEEGLIKETTSRGTGREKIRYTITQAGLNILSSWMKASNDKDSIRSEALLKFYLSTDDEVDDLTRHLEEFQKQYEEQLHLFRQFQEQLTELVDMHQNHKYILQVLSLGIHQAKLYSEWSRDFREKIQDGHLKL